MAIRPTDLQGAIYQTAQTAQLAQRAEEAPRLAQAAAQAAFVQQTERRNETIEETGESLGNKVDADAQGQGGAYDADGQPRRARSQFEETVDEAAGLDEPPHHIDFTA